MESSRFTAILITVHHRTLRSSYTDITDCTYIYAKPCPVCTLDDATPRVILERAPHARLDMSIHSYHVPRRT